MKKRSLKKLAFLGLASGLLATEADAKGLSDSSQETLKSDLLAFKKCGGAGGCSGVIALEDETKTKSSSSPSEDQNSGDKEGGLLAKCGSKCSGVISWEDSKTKSKPTSNDDEDSEDREEKLFAKCGSKCSGVIALEEKTKNAIDKAKDDYSSDNDPNSSNLGYHLMTEDELLLELNDEGVKLYNQLSPQGKELARKVASARCNGTNECKGLNACKSDKNDCAGKGDCKGQGKCAISDKNLAVKLVSQKMAQKRSDALNK